MNRTILATAGVLSASSLLLVDSAVKGTVLLALAAVAALILRRDSAATRHLVWLLAIVALLVVPLLSAMLPQWRVLPAWASHAPNLADVNARPLGIVRPADLSVELQQPSARPEIERSISIVDQPAAPVSESQAAIATPKIHSESTEWSWNWINALPLVWAIGFSVLILRLTAARWMLWNSERRATVVNRRVAPQLASESRIGSATAQDPIVMAMAGICSQLGISGPVTLLIHPEKTIPVVWGILRCRLMLPAAARQWSDEQLRSVLLHELAHIKRRDTLVQLLAQVARALHWFNPLVWFAAWRLDVERERACDDLVLASGVRPSAYAGHLLDVVTGLSPTRWTQTCGLAMARKSSLEGRLTAVLGKNLNRRRVSVVLAGLALAVAAGIAVPIAMLRAADEWNPPHGAHIGSNEFSAFCIHDGKEATLVIAYQGDFDSASRSSSNAKDRTWTDSVTLTAKQPGIALSFHRTHTAPGKLSITTAPAEGRDLSKPAPPPREFGQKEYELAKGRVFQLSDNGAVRQIDIAAPIVTDQKSAKKLAALIAAIPPQDSEASMVKPMHKDARAYYEVWQRYARANGDIPGAMVGELATAIKTFIRYNPTWETVPKLNEVLPRLDATHDWKPADAITLLDEVAGIQHTLLEPAPWKGTRDTIRQGDALPKKYADVTWGEEQPSGLRAAWVLEPSAAEHRIGTALKARLLVQNRGQVPVILQVPTWHQGWVKGTDAKGSEVQVSGIEWTTMALLNTVRLGPGASIEINTPGVGIGPRAGMGPWAGPRVGSNVLAKPGDELTLTYSLIPLDGSEVGVSEDDPHVSGPGWWLAHIKTRLNRELPLPADAAERTRTLDRAVRELFATAPTAEETEAFIADKTPEALDALAKRLVARVDVVSFSGKLPTAPVKFRVLDADANADKQPCVVLGPGEYPLPCVTAERGQATLKIVGRPVGGRRTNDAQLLFEPVEFTGILPPDPHKLEVPDGWGTWAIVCRPNDGFFYLLHKGRVRKIDYSAPRKVTDTPVNDLPAEFRDEVKRQLDIHEISAEQQAEIFEEPAAAPATNLRSDEQEKPKTAATESPPKTPEKEPFTAWGKEVGGLQAGLGFKAGEKRAYTHGETVDLVLRVRNVGKEIIKFSYFRDEFYENPPVATDDVGKSVHIEGAGLDGEPNRIELNLAPGNEVDLSEINLGLRPASEKGKQKPAWKLFGTGKFQLQCERVAGNFEDRVNGGPDPILSKLATGKLELEVTGPEKLPPEKETPTGPSNTAAETAKPKPNYVTVVGRLLDDETGQPIEKAGWEWGMADLKQPDQISWGHSRSMGGSYPDGKFEMLLNIGANGHHYPLRVYSAGYETTVVVDELAKPYPEKIERIVRLKRGRNITGVLRDHTGNPVANGWVFFIPKGHQTNIVESIPGTDAHQLPANARDGAVAEVRTNENGTFALSTGVAGTLAASTDLVDLWPFPLPVDGYAELKMPAPSYLVIDLTYWYLDELAQKEKRAISPNSEDPNQCWIQLDQNGSSEPLWKNLGYRRQMLVFAKDPRARLSKGVIVGHVVEGEMVNPIPDVGHNKNLSTRVRVALPPGNYRVQRLRTGPFAPVDEQNVELKSGEDTILSWARGDGSSVRGKATWPANMMFVRQPGEAPRKLDWTVPSTATVWIAPVGADGKDGKPIDAAKIQADGSFFVPTNLDPGTYKATARVSLPESDDSRRFRGYRGPDCIANAEFTVPDPARGLFGSPPVELEIKMEVAENVRFLRANAPADPPQAVQPPAGKAEELFTAWGKEVGVLQAGLGFKAGAKRAYSHGETVKVVLRVRNVGKEAVDFKHIWAFFVENPPAITDADDKPVHLPRLEAEGEHGPDSLEIAPGKAIELYEWKLELRPETPRFGRNVRSSTLYGTGKFGLQCERIVGPTSANPHDPNPAMSKLATGKLELEIQPVALVQQETPKPKPGTMLKPATEQKLKWGEPVNGLRMALAWPPTLGEPGLGDTPEFYLVVQNVSEKGVRLTANDAAPNPRMLNLFDATIVSRTVDDVPIPGDWLLQPHEAAFVRLFHAEQKSDDGRTISVLKENVVSTLGQYSYTAEMSIGKSPAGAWTGKLVTGATRGSADVLATGKPIELRSAPPMSWGLPKDGLRGALRIIGDLRTGKEAKAELWVRNSSSETVKFSWTHHPDVGLAIVPTKGSGPGREAHMTRGKTEFQLYFLALPAGQAVKLKEFTIRLGSPPTDGPIGVVSLELTPGDWTLQARWTDTLHLIEAAMEWRGALNTAEIELKVTSEGATVVEAPKQIPEPLKPAAPATPLSPAELAPTREGPKTEKSKDGAAPTSATSTPPLNRQSSKLLPATEQKLKWGEPVNGLRAALVMQPVPDEPAAEDKNDIFLVVQNVTKGEVWLHASDAAPNPRRLIWRDKGVLETITEMAKPIPADFRLQPGEVAFFRMTHPPGKRNPGGRSTGSLIEESIRKDPTFSLEGSMEISTAPEGAWSGKVVSGRTEGGSGIPPVPAEPATVRPEGTGKDAE